MNDTGNSFGSNPASLKGKLQTLEVTPSLSRVKSRISRMNSTTTRRKCRSFVVKKIPLNQFSPWKQLMSRRAYQTNLFASKRRCTYALNKEKTLQLPEGRKQSNPATNHLFEGRKDSSSATTPWPSTKNYRTGDAGWQLRSMIVDPLKHY